MSGVMRGAACEASWNASAYDLATVSAARALAPGFVMQNLSSGNGCMGAVSFVIHDCEGGESLVIRAAGYDFYAPDLLQSDAQLETKLTRAAGRKAVDLAALRKVASRHGVTEFTSVSQGAAMEFGGRMISFNCGCKTLFPQMGGRG